jgi:hypothetical protein
LVRVRIKKRLNKHTKMLNKKAYRFGKLFLINSGLNHQLPGNFVFRRSDLDVVPG